MSSQGPFRDRLLPLTEPARDPPTSDDEQLIARLVDSFYAVIRADAVLGPIFMSRVVDWNAHLSKIRDFWSTIVLQSGRYSGRPIQAHQQIAELTGAHFDRWLALWSETLDREVPAVARPAFLKAAQRMAGAMRVQLVDDEG